MATNPSRTANHNVANRISKTADAASPFANPIFTRKASILTSVPTKPPGIADNPPTMVDQAYTGTDNHKPSSTPNPFKIRYKAIPSLAHATTPKSVAVINALTCNKTRNADLDASICSFHFKLMETYIINSLVRT